MLFSIPRPKIVSTFGSTTISSITTGKQSIQIFSDCWKTRSARSKYGMLKIRSFLTQSNRNQVFSMICDLKPKFVPTQIRANNNGTPNTINRDFRRSSQIREFPPWQDFFFSMITALIPDFCSHYDIPLFTPNRKSCLLDRTGHGEFFRPHKDDYGMPNCTMTFVYYVHTSQFEGGKLVFPEKNETVDPEDNMLVMFPSGWLHEIQEVICIPDDFEKGRFTIHGSVDRL